EFITVDCRGGYQSLPCRRAAGEQHWNANVAADFELEAMLLSASEIRGMEMLRVHPSFVLVHIGLGWRLKIPGLFYASSPRMSPVRIITERQLDLAVGALRFQNVVWPNLVVEKPVSSM